MKFLSKTVQLGVTLTELLVFFCVFSLFATVVLTFIARSQNMCAHRNKKSDRIAQITSAHDWFLRDIHGIDTERDTVTVHEKIVVISNAQEKIIWKFQYGTLFRSVQRFDSHSNEWKKPSTAHVVDSIAQLTFKQWSQRGIECHMSYLMGEKKYSVLYSAALRNGVL